MNRLSKLESLHQAVILFDGICNLCNNSVNFVIDRDKAGKFKFAALQAPEAKPYLEMCNRSADDLDDLLKSIVLIEGGVFYSKSTAALRIAKNLDGLWPLLYAFILVPRFLRDIVYDWIARNRYNWFGKRESCRLPTPELMQRFLVNIERRMPGVE